MTLDNIKYQYSGFFNHNTPTRHRPMLRIVTLQHHCRSSASVFLITTMVCTRCVGIHQLVCPALAPHRSAPTLRLSLPDGGTALARPREAGRQGIAGAIRAAWAARSPARNAPAHSTPPRLESSRHARLSRCGGIRASFRELARGNPSFHGRKAPKTPNASWRGMHEPREPEPEPKVAEYETLWLPS